MQPPHPGSPSGRKPPEAPLGPDSPLRIVRDVARAALPRVLPTLVLVGWVVSLAAAWIALGRTPGPRRVAVEGAASWREAQAARLACTFSQGWHHAEGPRVWTICPDDAGVYGIARVDLPAAGQGGVLLRRWPLPEALRVTSPVGGEPESPQEYLAVEAAYRAPGEPLAVVVSRWQGEEGAVHLLLLRDEGGVAGDVPLDVEPLLLRGFVRRGGAYELALEDGRVLAVREGVVEERGRLPGTPDEEGVSVELAAPTAAGWDVLWSREVSSAEEGAPGERAVFRSAPGGGAGPAPVGTLATTDRWPWGEYVELAAGNVVNGYLPAMKRLRCDGEGCGLEPVPPEGSPPAERGMSLIFGPSSFLAREGRMDPVRTLVGDSFALQALRVRDGWLWLHAGQAGLAVAGDPEAHPPVVASGWQPTNPWVAAGPEGALWLADATGAYVLLGPDLGRADPPGALDRLAAVVAGERVQLSAWTGGTRDGIEDAAELRALARRASLPVALGAPPILLVIAALARLPRAPRARRVATLVTQAACAAWLAAMIALLSPLAAALTVI